MLPVACLSHNKRDRLTGIYKIKGKLQNTWIEPFRALGLFEHALELGGLSPRVLQFVPSFEGSCRVLGGHGAWGKRLGCILGESVLHRSQFFLQDSVARRRLALLRHFHPFLHVESCELQCSDALDLDRCGAKAAQSLTGGMLFEK